TRSVALEPSQMSALPQPFSGSTIHGGSPALRAPQSVSFGTTQRRRYSPGAADDGTRAGARRSRGLGSAQNCYLSQVPEPGRRGKRKSVAASIVAVFTSLSGKSSSACGPSHDLTSRDRSHEID